MVDVRRGSFVEGESDGKVWLPLEVYLQYIGKNVGVEILHPGKATIDKRPRRRAARLVVGSGSSRRAPVGLHVVFSSDALSVLPYYLSLTLHHTQTASLDDIAKRVRRNMPTSMSATQTPRPPPLTTL